ncbi:hypothetical protein, partial [Pseudomonas fulva]|uniref:hypothetical protein n=1 Tax=Pseudomonas fulva TaxID=47880 RepID=UPI002B1DE437
VYVAQLGADAVTTVQDIKDFATLGYTPENQANKATDFSTKNHTKFPTTQAVDENYVSVNSQSLSAPQKSQVKSNIGLSNT